MDPGRYFENAYNDRAVVALIGRGRATAARDKPGLDTPH